MLRSLRLHDVGPASDMHFKPGERLNAITGDNGLGKSFLLDLAWWSVTRTWAGTPILPQLDRDAAPVVDIEFAATTKTAKLKVAYDRAEQSWRFPAGKPGQPGLVVYARVDGDFAVWDSNRRFGGHDESVSGIPKGLVFSRQDVWDGLKLEGGKPICNGLLADWVTWQQTNSWEAVALAETLRLLSPAPDEILRPGRPTRADLLDARLIPTLEMPYGQDVPVTVASAGMKRVIALAYLLVWAWREHLEVSRYAGRPTAERMLLIIDEVESHLHPKWQRVILSSIVEAIAQLTNGGLSARPDRQMQVQYIVATHSPLVLASLEPLFDDRIDQLFELDLHRESGEVPTVVLEAPDFTRHGGADRWLMSEAFGLSSSSSVEAENAINAAAALFEQPRPDDAAIAVMEKRLSAVLADIDPFWARWRALIDARPSAA